MPAKKDALERNIMDVSSSTLVSPVMVVEQAKSWELGISARFVLTSTCARHATEEASIPRPIHSARSIELVGLQYRSLLEMKKIATLNILQQEEQSNRPCYMLSWTALPWRLNIAPTAKVVREAGVHAPRDAMSRKSPSAQSSTLAVYCDACRQAEIVGTRYKCKRCFQYDLCEGCYEDGKHEKSHSFWKIDRVGSDPIHQEPRL